MRQKFKTETKRLMPFISDFYGQKKHLYQQDMHIYRYKFGFDFFLSLASFSVAFASLLEPRWLQTDLVCVIKLLLFHPPS